MPETRHYEVDVTVRFRVDGPLAPHEAVRAAEGRLAGALEHDDPGGPVSAANIIAVTAGLVDASGARRRGTGALL